MSQVVQGEESKLEKKGEEEEQEEVVKPPSPKSCTTFNEDVVEILNSDHQGSVVQVGVVTRCWADEQNPDALLEAKRLGIDFTPLKPGYLEVLFPDGSRKEVLESNTRIVDRGFLRGDLVRPARPRNTPPLAHKPQAGIILELSSKVQLQRVLATQQEQEEEIDLKDKWFDTKDLVANARLNRGDHVIFKDWVGLVEEVFEMAVIETGNNGGFRRVCDVGTNLSVGPATEAVQAMLMERTGGFLSNFLGTNDVKTILDIKQLTIAVNWLCRNPLSSSSSSPSNNNNDNDDWKRPKRYWTDLDQLKLVRATADHLRTIHDKLVPRDPSNLSFPTPPESLQKKYPPTFHSSLSIFSVKNSRTKLKVLWQDGTVSENVDSFDFEQVQVVDDLELETFPGDLGLLSLGGGGGGGGGGSNSVAGEEVKGRCGIVQSMDSKKRTIKLRYLDSEEEEVVSAIEFDPHGPPLHEYGLRRGDYIVITNPESGGGGGGGGGGGVELPEIPSLGESETKTSQMPSGEPLRIELSSLGLSFAQNLTDSFKPPLPKTSFNDLKEVDWYGEVWDLLLNGNLVVRFPNGEKKEIGIRQVVRLDDGMMDPHAEMMAQAQEEMGMHVEEEDDDGMSIDGDEGGDQGWTTEEEEDEGQGQVETNDDDEKVRQGVTNSRKRKRSRRESRGWADEEDEEEEEEEQQDRTSNPRTVHEQPLPTAENVPSTSDTPLDKAAGQSTIGAVSITHIETRKNDNDEDDENWQRFEILEEIPRDHHYSNESAQEVPSKQFISRVRKEHKVLSSSLPPNILVRGYESRLDLLRCLIIGPEGTPFEHAPFLFDLYLSTSKFPLEPPKVFFHSWAAGGTTRVSPNLYAEGKVCLSLLGTWSGDKTESWSSARSSILQILISIQGLIMVENPYFTEPGFEKQIGTPEGTTASQIYNERSFVLNRGFIKRACEYPPQGFEKEINHFYYGGGGGGDGEEKRLKGIVEQCRELLKESDQFHSEGEEEEGKQSQVVPSLKVLSEGGALSLRRTLKSLEELLERRPKK
ncbi:hypothetical protein JCM5350_000217 [Sporobolomyces pararoseus]